MAAKKIIRNIFFIATAFVLLLVVLAEVFKNDMIKLGLEKGAKTFDVPLTVGEVEFSLLYRFPLATIQFNDVVAFGHAALDSLGLHTDTIASISRLYASVDIRELIKGNLLVRKVDIENVKAKYVVDSMGVSNFDFLFKAKVNDTLKVDADTTIAQGVFTLDKLTLKNIELKYEDDFINTSAQVNIPKLVMNGKAEALGFRAATEGEVIVQMLRYDSYHLDLLTNSSIKFSVDARNDTIHISSLKVKAGSALLNLEGSAFTKDSTLIALTFSGSEIDMAENLSMLPQNILEDHKIKGIQGRLDIDGSLQGYITKNIIPSLALNISMMDGGLQYDVYPDMKNIILEAHFSNGYSRSMESSVLTIKKLQVQTDLSSIDLSATITNPKHLQYDVLANINADLGELLPFLPDSSLRKMSGQIKANMSSIGVLPDSIDAGFVDYFLEGSKFNISLNQVSILKDSLPSIQNLGASLDYSPGTFKLSVTAMEIPDYKISLTHGYLQGSYKGQLNDYKNLSLQIDSFLVASPYSYASAKANFDGLKKVKYNLNSFVNISLSEVKQWLPDSLANSMTGTLSASINSAGHFDTDSISEQAMPLLFNNSIFALNLKDIYLNMPDTLINVKMLSGNVKYKNDSIWVGHLSANYLGLDLSADSTTISHVYTGAVQNKRKEMVVQGNFAVGDMSYAWIENFMVDTVLVDNLELEPYKMNFTYTVKGNLKAKSIKYEEVFIENLDTKFLAKVDKGYYVLDALKCKAFGGDINASVKYEMFANFRDVLHFKTDMQQVDMSRMLKELATYIDQEDFTDKNVLGKLTAQLDGKIILQDYAPVYDSLFLKGNLVLKNGALINVKPVMEIEDISFIGLKNMNKLYFSTIESQLFLFKNKMYFPRTNIRSSSFDGMFFGMYSFGEDYAYHVKMYLNHVLSGKNSNTLRKQAHENGFQEELESDGRRPIYVVSKKEKGKTTAWFDNTKDRKNMVARVNLQEQMVSFIFSPQLVLYNTEE